MMLFVWGCFAEPPYTTRYTDYLLRFGTDAATTRELLEWTNSVTITNLSTSFTNLLTGETLVINGDEVDHVNTMIKIGYLAGDNIDDTYDVTPGSTLLHGRSIYIGPWAGQNSGKGGRTMMIGHRVGAGATNTWQSTIIGFGAAIDAASAQNSTIVGNRAGGRINGAPGANLAYSVMVGNEAGRYAQDVSYSTFVGAAAGYQRTNATYSTFIGVNAGRQLTTPVNNAIAIGYNSANTKSYQTVIGNSSTTEAVIYGNHVLKARSAPTVTGTDIVLWNSNGVLYAVSSTAATPLTP